MTTEIVLTASASGFAEDKEAAKELRLTRILPALERGDSVILDFGQVSFATQSYIHALIGEPLRKHQEKALERLEFKNCSPQLKSLVKLVVDYSLGGFADESVSRKPRRVKRAR
jgi:hypothetical protein